MGLFDGRSYSDIGTHRRHSRSHSYRGHSPARSTRSTHSKSSGYFVRPSASRSNSSFFGASGGSRGIFGSSGSSYYKRSPRQGYISYLYHKLQRMLRELWYYARRHPVKAFFAVIVPLLSAGGAIGGLMKQFGVRIPGMDNRGSGSRRMGGGYYGSSGYGREGGGGLGGLGGGLMDNAGGIMQIAKAFM